MENMIPMPSQANVSARAPQSNLRLYSGVPWDNSYQHVRLYNSQIEALSSLESYRVLYQDARLNQVAPIRVGSLEVKIPFTEMETLNLNYMTFLNKGFSNTWVFAFITSIEWLSQETTRVHFELDIWQNNIYNCTMKPCFVDRMHIPKSQDTIGNNLFPESIETGDFVCYQHTFVSFGTMYAALLATQSPAGDAIDGALRDNVYWGTGLDTYIATEKGVEQLNAKLKEYTDNGGETAIANLIMAPSICINAARGVDPSTVEGTFQIGTPFGGYTPKNNKLYSSPYLYAIADNNSGQSNTYMFEYSSEANHALHFVAEGAMSTTPGVLFYPKNYKGAEENYTESLTYTNFPVCAFNTDVYKSWLAYNQNAQTINAVTSGASIGTQIAGAVASARSGDVGGAISQGTSAVSNTISTVGDIMVTREQKQLEPNVLHGKALNSAINAGLELQRVDIYLMSITREFAERIDDYWTVFGYPVRSLVTPTMNNRSSWDYLKTVGCGITGKVDLDQLKKLRAIFDNGVFNWHTNDIGNFGLANN